MNNNEKKTRILDAMQELMAEGKGNTVTVSEIAKKAGIGKGSIYYYFQSKNDIIEGVIERSYSRVLEAGRNLAASEDISVFQKLEIIHRACLDAARELRRQEMIGSFSEQQQSALIHQKFSRIIITELKPILTDILRQGVREQVIQCDYPEEYAHITLLFLTVTLDNSLVPLKQEELSRTLLAFTQMQERGLNIPAGIFHFVVPEQ
ncbi:MAG: TetR/AcrR family transcriptional regulator [Eubacteriales bacterium]|nr:TetR/AcrR family transcriptional regulator [Eubacteriales bacterium]